jgi:hypothetical protein
MTTEARVSADTIPDSNLLMPGEVASAPLLRAADSGLSREVAGGSAG